MLFRGLSTSRAGGGVGYYLRLFSTRRNFPGAAQLFFVCELPGKTNRKKTKKNCAAHGKLRLVENSLNGGGGTGG